MKRNPLSKITKHYTNQKKKKAVSLLKNLILKIENGELDIVSFGWWSNSNNTLIAKFEASFENYPEDSETLE